MFIENIPKKCKKRDDIERKYTLGFAKLLKGVLTQDEIEEKLAKSLVNGVYVLPKEQFNKIIEKDTSSAIYSFEDKAIFLNDDMYKSNKTIMYHELGHALLGHEKITEIMLDERILDYGVGLEEGTVSILSGIRAGSLNNLKYFDARHLGYGYQSKLIFQLNELYKRVIDLHPNMLVHILKEDETFCELTKIIYDEVLKSNGAFAKNDRKNLAMKSAKAIVFSSDYFVDDCMDIDSARNLKSYTYGINTIYYYLLSNGFVKPEEIAMPFKYINSLSPTSQEVLLNAIFGEKSSYDQRLASILSDTCVSVDNLLEQADPIIK